MKDNEKVINYLNELLAGELAARDQYFLHSRIYADMGLSKLAERIRHEMEDETSHADQFIKRILALGGTPKVVPGEMIVGNDIPSMLEADLKQEYLVRDNLKNGVLICEEAGDYVTREILVKQLEETEEDHAHWLEQQLNLIKLMGLQNYIQMQV